jgi:puromycin-sensitive aminopeptidase
MKRAVVLYSVVLVLSVFVAAQRLPQTAVPDNYNLTFAPDFSKDNFAGDEVIQVRVLKPVSEIVLNAAEIEFGEAIISSHGASQTATVRVDPATETVMLAVGHELQPGPASIHIKYTGILNDQLRGFYRGKDAEGRKYAMTQFESTDARRAFPCFDEPAYKATFDITLTIDKDLIAIANTKSISDTPGPGDKHTVRFATSAKMSSYLAAFAVGHFEYIEGSADGIPIRVYTMPGKKELGRFALETTEFTLKYYDRYFGIKYPYGKLDLLSVPDFSAGAMENIGLITSRDILLEVDEKHTSLGQKKGVAITITHEIAHQWFGDLVTMQWWDDVWLNEGFATWMEGKPVDAWHPEWGTGLDEFSRGDALTTLGALSIDSLASTRSIHQPADTPAQIQELFDGIAYGKAASVLRMLEAYLGPETFRAGVDAYLKQYEYANATAEDFWNTLAKVSKKPVDKIMPTFVTQPGVPMVSIKTQCSSGSTGVSLAQRRYFYDRTLFNSANDQLWQVPVCLKTSGKAANQCVLLTEHQQNFSIPGCAAWVLANAGSNGYYRSGYQPEAVQALARDAETGLTPLERIGLTADTWAAVRIGQQPIGDFLVLTQGMQNDRVAAVRKLQFGYLDTIGNTLVSDDDHASYQHWVRAILAPLAREIGWVRKPNESDDTKDLRASLMTALGDTAAEPDTIAEARKLAQQALENPASVESALASAAFTVAARSGDAALYEKLLAATKSAKTPEQYYLYLFALSGFRDPQLLQRTLDLALSSDVRSQDKLNLIGAVIAKPAGQKLSWDFVRSHWNDVEKAGGPFASASIEGDTASFCSAELRDQVQEFFAAHKVASGERTLKQSLERINNCIELKSSQSNQLASWLQKQSSSAGD